MLLPEVNIRIRSQLGLIGLPAFAVLREDPRRLGRDRVPHDLRDERLVVGCRDPRRHRQHPHRQLPGERIGVDRPDIAEP